MKASHFSDDTQEFLLLLHKHNVKYMIVGGEAVIYYGYPRLTGDIDFFYENSSENIQSLFNALLEFWDEDIPGINDKNELSKPGYIIQFGVPPNRIDLLNDIDGVEFEEAWDEKKVENIQVKGNRVPVNLIGLKDLIKNKEATKRAKDIDDLEFLKQLL